MSVAVRATPRRSLALVLGLVAPWAACQRPVTLEGDPDAGPECLRAEDCELGFTCERGGGSCVREQPWGEYAATVAPGPCLTDGGVLVVNTTDDELALDGGLLDPSEAGPTLSLSEALAIAIQRPGPDTIVFDPAVFPVDAPATITSTRALYFTGDGAPFCVDARHRGVVLDWQRSGSWSFIISRGSTVAGLTFLNVARALQLNGALVACRWNHDGADAGPGAPDYSIMAAGIVGPGNSLGGGNSAISALGDALIISNFFGWDPVSRRVLPPPSQAIKIELPAQAQISGNVFAGGMFAINAWGSLHELTVGANYFGTNAEGDELPRPQTPFRVAATPRVVFGPNNVIRGGGVGVVVQLIDPDWAVHITRNRLLVTGDNHRSVITYFLPPSLPQPPLPPTLSVEDGGVMGSCGSVGWLEVFRVDAEGYSSYLGDQVCAAGTAEPLRQRVVPGDQLVATLTDAFQRTSPFSEPLTVP